MCGVSFTTAPAGAAEGGPRAESTDQQQELKQTAEIGPVPPLDILPRAAENSLSATVLLCWCLFPAIAS